jgi:hypothetical protein
MVTFAPHAEDPADHSQVSKLSDPRDDSGDTEANLTISTREQASKKIGDGSNVSNTLGESDIRCMTYSRILILCMLLLTAGVAGGLTYFFTSNQEQENFEAEVCVARSKGINFSDNLPTLCLTKCIPASPILAMSCRSTPMLSR